MTKKLTVTIGIPAYNEASNIGLLIEDILKQQQDEYELERILIASDGSEDNTVEIIKNFKNKLINVLDYKERAGVAVRLNNLNKECNSDCLIILNADIRLKSKLTIDRLVKPITKGYALAAGDIVPLNPTTLLEKILNFGCIYKTNVFLKYKNGDNYLSCHGPLRAMSKKLYKNLNFSFSTGDDAFTYFYAKQNKLDYKYVKTSVAFYKLPTNFADHLKQAQRYHSLNNKLGDIFNKDFVAESMYIPSKLFVIEGLKLFLKYPVLSLLYVCLTCITYILCKLHSNEKQPDMWNMVLSSKVVK